MLAAIFRIIALVRKELLAMLATAASEMGTRGERYSAQFRTVANDLHSLRAGRHTIHLVRPGQPLETYSGDEAAVAIGPP